MRSRLALLSLAHEAENRPQIVVERDRVLSLIEQVRSAQRRQPLLARLLQRGVVPRLLRAWHRRVERMEVLLSCIDEREQ